MVGQSLMALSATIIFTMGTLHLVFTLWGSQFSPRDPTTEVAMKATSPVLTGETSMWQAWIGFNASHSLGAMLFGLVYGYLALMQPDLLLRSGFLLAVGCALLTSYVALAKAYWFSAPFAGITLALACFAAGVATSLIGG